jgi:hypothetical protein
MLRRVAASLTLNRRPVRDDPAIVPPEAARDGARAAKTFRKCLKNP